MCSAGGYDTSYSQFISLVKRKLTASVKVVVRKPSNRLESQDCKSRQGPMGKFICASTTRACSVCASKNRNAKHIVCGAAYTANLRRQWRCPAPQDLRSSTSCILFAGHVLNTLHSLSRIPQCRSLSRNTGYSLVQTDLIAVVCHCDQSLAGV